MARTLAIVVLALVSTVSFSYAQASLPVRVVEDFHFGEGFPSTRTTTEYTYDSAGRVLQEVLERDTFTDGSVDFRVKTTYEYDSNGNLVTKVLERDFQADDVIDETERSEWTYDNQGRRTMLDTLLTTAFSSLLKASRTVFVYEQDRLVNEWVLTNTDFDSDVDRVSLITYTYDGDGRVEQKNEVVTSDITTSPLVFAAEYDYDVHGNVERTQILTDFNADGTVDSAQLAHAVYDGGRLVGEATYFDFDVDGTAESVESLTRSYDSSGHLLTETLLFDSGLDGADHGTLDTSSYDSAGRLEETVRVNLAGPFVGQTTTTQYFY